MLSVWNKFLNASDIKTQILSISLVIKNFTFSDFLYKLLSRVPLGTKNMPTRERSIVHPSRSKTSTISLLFLFFFFSFAPSSILRFPQWRRNKNKKSTKTLRLLEPVAPVEMFGDGSCVKMVHRWSAGTAPLLHPVHDSAAFSSLKCKWGGNEVDLNFRRRTSFKRWSPGCRRWAPWPRAPRSADTPHCGSQGSGRCPNHSGTEGARADRYCPPGNPPETHTNVMSGRRNTWSTTFMVPIQDGGKIC